MFLQRPRLINHFSQPAVSSKRGRDSYLSGVRLRDGGNNEAEII